MSFETVLVANRGEIAYRVIRSCQSLGIETVLAASDADLESMPARQADAVVRLGPSRSAESYLNVEAVIQAARACEADAIHPGYGFLSEDARLAQACEESRIVFIGATKRQLELMGDKLAARREAEAAGLPVVPGGAVSDVREAQVLAEELGYPVLIKAVGGGGGRGIKAVDAPEKLAAAFELSAAEAEAAFGRGGVYLERLVTRARHVEVQLLGDGNEVIHLGDRDCSVQRRYQKLIEEAPAPDIPDKLRAAMHQAAVSLGLRLGYRGLGTVEFLLDCERESFHFLEMNTRIQVEHPVTEMITGIDLVAEQIAVAEGRPLGLRQEDIRFDGHAIECRINAEDPDQDFAPSPGKISKAIFPAGPGIRVDTHLESGSGIPPYYDALMAKIIVHRNSREEAVAAMQLALACCSVSGVASNLDFHRRAIRNPEFLRGGVDTRFVARLLAEGCKEASAA
jgi:acetyl-CoA carboxylase biotin carboxylase subunit